MDKDIKLGEENQIVLLIVLSSPNRDGSLGRKKLNKDIKDIFTNGFKGHSINMSTERLTEMVTLTDRQIKIQQADRKNSSQTD